MQYQICPRCKFRIMAHKAICNTCGYSFTTAKKAAPAAEQAPAPTNSLRKIQATSTGTANSFWRTFLGLSPAQSDSSDVRNDDRALGET